MSRTPTSTLVSGQLPEFIGEDYPLFTSFLEAYYEYLDSQINLDFKSIKDLDSVPDAFIQYIRDEISSISGKFLGNEKFLLSHVRDIYRSKGSEASFKLIFKLLYNKDIDIKYPQTQMLRVSDGKWQQAYSLFVSNVTGDIYSLVGNVVQIKTSVVTIALQVISVTAVADSVYEISVNKDFYGDIQVGSILSFETVSAVVVPTTTKIKIISGGKNFKPGELYSISSGGGTGTILKITKVDDVGAIVSAQILKFGLNYTNDFVVQIESKFDLLSSLTTDITSITAGAVGVSETYSGIQETGSISTFDYVDSIYLNDVTYVTGPNIASFSSVTSIDTLNPSNLATIKFTVGAVAKYPGYYTSNDGFLDDNIYIQDSKYYQIFSYDIVVSEQLDSYKSVLKTFIHPAGMALFGTYTIDNTFDISATNYDPNPI